MMPSGDILVAGLSKSNQSLSFIFLDLFWRFVWLALTLAMVALVTFWLVGEIGSTPLSGPELDTGNPIILISLIERVRTMYLATVLGALGAILVGASTLWLALEAAFRGGWKDFRLYFVSGAARTIILTAVAAILATMVALERTAGVAIIATIVMMGVWFMVTTMEILVRKDAVELVGLDLGALTAVMGFLFITELLLAFLLWGATAGVLLKVSGPDGLLGALLLAVVVAITWAVLQSYLMNVRFSTVDIMKRNLVDG